MHVNAMTEEFEHIEIFGKPVLFTNARVDKATVPEGWYRYNIRGSDYDSGSFGTLENNVAVNHAGTILSPEEIPLSKSKDYRPIRGNQNFLGEDMTLVEFCACHGLPIPESPQKYLVRPASPEEAGLFYAQTPEQDEKMGCIGHVRIDFGSSGKEFWHTWWPRGPEELNSPEFKAELGEVVDKLRESVLKDFSSMRSYCYQHGGEIAGGICTQNYGYTVETERYRYLLRCNPIEGDYQAYLACFDKQAQELAQVTVQCNSEQSNFPDGWREGDTCYLITNKAKRYTQPHTVESFDGTYFGVRGRTGLYYRVSQGRMFHTREDAVASLQQLEQKNSLIGRVTFASGEQIEYTDPSEYLKAIREELPYHATTGFRFETLTSAPEVRKAADDALYDLYGEEPPRPLEDYQEQPEQGMTMGGMQL